MIDQIANQPLGNRIVRAAATIDKRRSLTDLRWFNQSWTRYNGQQN